jgi:hypothetical protein
MTVTKRDDHVKNIERKQPLLWSDLFQQTGLPTDSTKHSWLVEGEKDDLILDKMLVKPEGEL